MSVRKKWFETRWARPIPTFSYKGSRTSARFVLWTNLAGREKGRAKTRLCNIGDTSYGVEFEILGG